MVAAAWSRAAARRVPPRVPIWPPPLVTGAPRGIGRAVALGDGGRRPT